MKFRVGNGFDVHRLAEGRKLVLGGVTVPYTMGCVAHSDGDALIHALCDAILGAMAKKDIGHYFPDSDAAYKDIDSRILLRKVYKIAAQEGYRIENADCTLVIQEPRIAPFIDGMRANIAEDLHVDADCVMVKATTSEALGFTGRKEGIAAMATVLLSREE